MKRIVLILGGARSGKSSFALKDAGGKEGKKAFIATAEAKDNEMAERIKTHRKERGKKWETIEEPIMVSDIILSLPDDFKVMVIDCLTLWLSNIIERGLPIEQEIKGLESALKERSVKTDNIYLISNEVGLGIVPDNVLARIYRDASGRLNQKMAEIATEVYLMVAGIPLLIKGEKDEGSKSRIYKR